MTFKIKSYLYYKGRTKPLVSTDTHQWHRGRGTTAPTKFWAIGKLLKKSSSCWYIFVRKIAIFEAENVILQKFSGKIKVHTQPTLLKFVHWKIATYVSPTSFKPACCCPPPKNFEGDPKGSTQPTTTLACRKHWVAGVHPWGLQSLHPRCLVVVLRTWQFLAVNGTPLLMPPLTLDLSVMPPERQPRW